MEINKVGEAPHAFNCAQRVASGDRILVVVAQGVLNQLGLADVELHVAVVLRHVHLLKILRVGREPVRRLVALITLGELLLRFSHVLILRDR